MDEAECFAEIERRGWEPTALLAVSLGIETGRLDSHNKKPRERIMTVSRKRDYGTVEGQKTRTLQKTVMYCECASCGETIRTSRCPNCGHDNYEIMAIKGRREE